MNCTRIQELAAAYALGALDRPEAARLEALATADSDLRAEVDAFRAIAGRLLENVARIPPPAAVRENILERIRRTPQAVPPAPPSPPVGEGSPVSFPSGFRFLRPDEGQWFDGGVPGLRLQALAHNVRNNYSLLFIELAPGATYPQHEHSGSEELFVVSGDLETEGQTMKAGDFLHSDRGTVHHDLYSPHGCRAILVTPLTSTLGEAARLQLRKVGQQLLQGLGMGKKE